MIRKYKRIEKKIKKKNIKDGKKNYRFLFCIILLIIEGQKTILSICQKYNLVGSRMIIY